MNFSNFIVKSLQLALIADQAWAETQVPGGNPSTILQPNNFQTLLMELATVFAKPATVPPAPPQPGN